MMNEIILKAESEGLKNSFFLHISPNLGNKNGRETIKLSSKDDIGSTDIQLLIKGAVKDSGVLFLLNKFIEDKTGKAPLEVILILETLQILLREKLIYAKGLFKQKICL